MNETTQTTQNFETAYTAQVNDAATGVNEAAVEEKKPYTLKRLQSQDVFPMFRIINKIGIKEFKECFSSPSVMSAIEKIATSEDKGNGEDNGAMDMIATAGVSVALDIASIIVENVPKCEQELYAFLAQLSGKTPQEIAELDMVVFFEMIVDVIKKEEFRDFIGVVSRLFK